MKKTTLNTTTLLATVLTAASVSAVAEDKPLRTWTGNAEFGYVAVDGNSESTSIKAAAEAGYEEEKWRDTVKLESFNSKSTTTVNGVEQESRSAERYFISNKADWKFSEFNYAFFLLSYEKDRFGSFEEEQLAAVGYGRRILNNDTMTWDVEIGPGYRYNKYDDGTDNDELIARLATKYEWKISETATFGQVVNVDSGSDNTVTRSITSLQASLVGSLSLKLAYEMRYSDKVNEAPGEEIDHADTITSATLLYKF